MFLIDTHCHLEDPKFENKEEIVNNFSSNGGIIAINMGCDLNTSIMCKNLAEKYDVVYFGAGWHPQDVSYCTDSDFEKMAELTNHPKCVSVGEVGLDYYFEPYDKIKQQEVFIKQIELASKTHLPLSIHSREATLDMLNILKEYKSKLDFSGTLHCFSGSKETAKILLDLGFYISFGGTVTFKNSVKAVEVAKYIPLDRMLTETDCPYLAPTPLRGTRNEPKNVALVEEFLATLREIDREEMGEILKENTLRLFNKIKL